MHVNTTYVPLHRPIIRYDEDGNYFFSQIGTLIHNLAEGNIDDVFGKSVMSRMGECGYDGEIIQEDGTPHNIGIIDIESSTPAICFFGNSIPGDHPTLLYAAYRDHWDLGFSYRAAYEKHCRKLCDLGALVHEPSSQRTKDPQYTLNLLVAPQKSRGRHKSYLLSARYQDGLPFDYGFTKESTPEEVARLIREDVEGVLGAVYGESESPVRVRVSIVPDEGLTSVPEWLQEEKVVLALKEGDLPSTVVFLESGE